MSWLQLLFSEMCSQISQSKQMLNSNAFTPHNTTIDPKLLWKLVCILYNVGEWFYAIPYLMLRRGFVLWTSTRHVGQHLLYDRKRTIHVLQTEIIQKYTSYRLKQIQPKCYFIYGIYCIYNGVAPELHVFMVFACFWEYAMMSIEEFYCV